MRKDQLERIIGVCIKEVLELVPEISQPPQQTQQGGQVLAQPSTETNPSDTPKSIGIYFINPKKLFAPPELKVFKFQTDPQLERDLHKVASAIMGPSVIVAANTLRSVKNFIQNPIQSIYLYIGKQNDESGELYLLADKNYYSAKGKSVGPETVEQQPPEPNVGQKEPETGNRSQTTAPKIDEIKLYIKKLIKESIKHKR
jgi:hypothetical protein